MARRITAEELTRILEKLRDPDLRGRARSVDQEGWIKLNSSVSEIIAQLFTDWSESRAVYASGLLRSFGYVMSRRGGISSGNRVWYLRESFVLPITPEMLARLHKSGPDGLPGAPRSLSDEMLLAIKLITELRDENNKLKAENERLLQKIQDLTRRIQELEASTLSPDVHRQFQEVLFLPGIGKGS